MSRKIKVLFTISNFNTAGSGKVVYDLVNGLDKSKFDIEIACEDSNGAFFKTMESLGLPIRIFRTKTHYRPYHTLLFRIWNISKFYKKHQYDLIHSWQWSNDWTEAMAARLIGIKWIYTKKAMGFRSKHWKIKSWLAHFIVTINDEMRDYFPNKKAQALIPLGIDTDYYCSDTFKNNKTTNKSKFNIITVANLVPVKGIEVLLQAVKELNNASLHVTILGANDNDYGQEMMALSKALGIDNQVDFIGKQLDVRPYIAKSDLYIIPTLNKGRKEGMPMALVEAMSMGIPLLGSDITGINFVLKDFRDLLFEAGNVEALAQKINYMQSLPEDKRAAIGHELRAYCMANYSMKAFIDAHEALYKELVLT